MADVLLAYPAASDATITLASLATDASLLTGVESAAISNLTNKYLDYLISGKIRTGTSPTTAKAIQVWAVASWDGTNWPDGFDGTASAETILSANHKNAICRLVSEMVTDATSDREYAFSCVSIRDLFGGVVPPAFVLFVTHNTAVNLNATAGNHQIRIQGVYETVA
jgi:hypothetical protein